MTNRNFPEHRSIQSGSDESGEHEFVLSNRADWPERHCDRLGAAEVVSVHTREGRRAGGRSALSRVIRRISQLCIALRLHTFGQVASDERAQTRGGELRRMRGLRDRPGLRGPEGSGPNEKERLCVSDSCAAWAAGVRAGEEGGGMQLQFVPLTVRGKNGYCLAGEKRIELL